MSNQDRDQCVGMVRALMLICKELQELLPDQMDSPDVLAVLRDYATDPAVGWLHQLIATPITEVVFNGFLTEEMQQAFIEAWEKEPYIYQNHFIIPDDSNLKIEWQPFDQAPEGAVGLELPKPYYDPGNQMIVTCNQCGSTDVKFKPLVQGDQSDGC